MATTKSIHFDYNACYRAIVERLIHVMDDLINEFYQEATSGLDEKGKSSSEKVAATVTDETDYTDFHSASGMAEFITAKCKFYADALMQSFGTGSLADTGSESYWEEYKQRSDFNRARKSTYIAGRPAGIYTDIWGNKRISSGSNEGKNLEGLHVRNVSGEMDQVKPMVPSRSIQNAERWIIKDGETRIERRLEMEINDFFATEAGKFFR